ncbi:hypothetical protein TWF730_006776 [Orbilia blumenaviensis]|uniref:Rhomboid-type serine protease n=1 Tax=Orbilia blumenaviensis TaxID=1796055 RepID=A0AAV9VLI2_9PEZI
MSAYDYYNNSNHNPAGTGMGMGTGTPDGTRTDAAATRLHNETPLSATTTTTISPGHVSSPPSPSSNPSPYYSQPYSHSKADTNNSSPYNPSLEDVRTTYKPSQEPYSLQEDTSYHGPLYNYDTNRSSSYGENIPLSEHPQHMAGASHMPAYNQNNNYHNNGNGGRNNNGTLPHPVPPMREKQLGFWARKRHKTIPFFCYAVSIIQVAVFIAEIVKNAQITGSPIQTKPSFNPMIGPSPYVMINMGARFVPCMKDTLTVGSSVSRPWACPNTTTLTVSTQDGTACSIQELCGFQDFTTPNQWWRFITPIFMHAGLIHIAFNLLIQLRLGTDMEREIGIIRFSVVYIASGIFGFVLGGNFAPQGLASTGASGALFGILALVLLDLFYTWKQRESPVKDLIFLLIDFAISFVLGLLPGVDNFAHIGGFLMGIALGLAFMRSPPALQSKLGKGDAYNSMSSASIQNQGLRRLLRDPVGFFRGRNPFWWVWWLLRAAMLALSVIAFILLLRNFYIFNGECSWCRYFTCLPVSNWCDIGNLQRIEQTPARKFKF